MIASLNPWIALLVFTISLPVAVMTGAALLGLRDTESKTAGLVRLLVCAAILLMLLLAFGTSYHRLMLGAFGLVTSLHLLAYWGLRWPVREHRKP